jgi:flagellar biosynthesis protein FlhB
MNEPSNRRIEAARRHGRIARSGGLTGAAVLLVGLLLGFFGLFSAGQALRQYAAEAFSAALSGAEPLVALEGSAIVVLSLCAPLAVVASLAAILAGLVQSRGLVAPQALGRVGLAAGWRRLVHTDRLVEIAGIAGASAVAGLLAVFAGRTVLATALRVSLNARKPDAAVLVTVAGDYLVYLVVFGGAAGLCALAWRTHVYRRDLRMTPRELREERRETEVNEQMRRERENIARADLVATRPARA